MNKKIKTILSYIGVALLGALTGVGALVGVSSCSQSEKTTTPLKSAATPQRKQITSDYEQIIGSDKTYYAVAKNYAVDGNGVFYYNNDRGDSAIMSTDYYPPDGRNSILVLDMQLINEEMNSYNTVFVIGTYATYTDMGNFINYKLSYVNINERGAIYYRDYSIFNRELCAFIFTNAVFNTSGDAHTTNISFFYQLFDIYEIDYAETFTFNKNLNYNAFAQYGSQIASNVSVYAKSPFVHFGPLDQSQTDIDFYVGPFLTNGIVFDTISVRYSIATTDLLFEWQGGYSKSKLIENHNPYKYFSYMKYVNTATNFAITVCSRGNYLNSDGNTVISSEVAWLNNNYCNLTLITPPKENTYIYNILAMANNGLVSTGFNNGGDIGLGNAFTLIGTAFSSVTSLLSIAVLPGITLGLLLFLPLIAGIIVAIIWVVKR